MISVVAKIQRQGRQGQQGQQGPRVKPGLLTSSGTPLALRNGWQASSYKLIKSSHSLSMIGHESSSLKVGPDHLNRSKGLPMLRLSLRLPFLLM